MLTSRGRIPDASTIGAPVAYSGRLEPFDSPVFLDHSATGDHRRAPIAAMADGVVTRFMIRAAGILGLVAIIPFVVAADRRVALGAAVAIAIPLATAIDVARVHRRRPPRSTGGVDGYELASVVVDCLTVVALACIAGQVVIVATIGLAVIAFHRDNHDRVAAAVGLVTLVVATTTMAVLGMAEARVLDVVLLVGVGSSVLVLVGSHLHDRAHTAAGLQLASDKANAVLAGIGDAIVIADPTGTIRETNPAAVRLLGTVAPPKTAHCEDQLALSRDGEMLRCQDRCALLDFDGPTEVWRTGPKGERQPLLANAVALCDAAGTPVEIVHSLRDITSIKAADEAKSLFLATSSHELKTPLAVIRGFAQLLGSGALEPATQAEAIESIERRSRELADIVDRLLMSSRIDAGKVELQLGLHDIARRVVQRITEFQDTSGGDVSLMVDPTTPHAWCDPSAIVTVVDHLLDNARKYAGPAGHTAVTIGLSGSGAEVLVSVSDDGVGMNDQEIAHCFDHFWQAEGTDVRRFGGTGVGLFIVRSLVAGMDGHVTVTSEPGAGACFTVSLRTTAPITRADVMPDRDRHPSFERDRHVSTDGEGSMIHEFMRQVGVLDRARSRP